MRGNHSLYKLNGRKTTVAALRAVREEEEAAAAGAAAKKQTNTSEVSCGTCVCFLFHRALCALIARSRTSSRLASSQFSICISFLTGCEFILNENFHRINKSTHRKINTHWITWDCVHLMNTNSNTNTLRPKWGRKRNEFYNKERAEKQWVNVHEAAIRIDLCACLVVDNNLCFPAQIYLAACEMMLAVRLLLTLLTMAMTTKL